MTTQPVFVDASGRRARLVRIGCWALACVFGGYVLLVAVALVVPPGTLSLTVPGLGPVLPKTQAPPLTTRPGGTGVPVSILAKLSPGPRGAAVGSKHRTTVATTATAHPTPSPSSSRPGNKPTSAPSATTAPTAVRGTGKPATHPTPHASKTPPGHP